MLDLPPDIHLRWLTDDGNAGEEAWSLSDEERRRMADFGSPIRRRSFCLGRTAARTLLGELLGIPPDRVDLQVRPDGSIAAPGTGLNVSIAHAGPHAVALAGERPLGVDLEEVRPRDPRLRNRIAHPDDRLPADLSDDEALVLLWTVKEAVLKAAGTGLRRPPRSLRVDLDAGAGSVEDGSGVWRVDYEKREGFWVAVAYLPRPVKPDA
jgi:4'-phosphopantetheinyl transferase